MKSIKCWYILDIKKYIDMNLNELCLYIIIDYIEIIIS